MESSDFLEKPAWYEEGSLVYSVQSRVPCENAGDAGKVRDVLEAAGIPCYMEYCEDPSEDDGSTPFREWRVFVPGKLNMRAVSVLDRDIFNVEFEVTWSVFLQTLSEEELSETDPREVFCGLFDKVERVIRIYKDEQARRAPALEQG